MGFLDSSSNNIIFDAVLTDVGRQFLSRNDGSFSLSKFAVSDDEVNYGIITRYGRTVGKEKIEKNTPIFEAATNAAHAQKYKMISVSNPNLLRLPEYTLTGDNVSSSTVTLGRNSSKVSTMTFSQTIQGESAIDVELVDQTFSIEMNNLFLQISGDARPQNIDGYQRAKYVLTRSAAISPFRGSTLQFTLSVKSLSDTQFTVYGMTADKTKIKTYIKVVGMQSGAVKDVVVIIDKNI